MSADNIEGPLWAKVIQLQVEVSYRRGQYSQLLDGLAKHCARLCNVDLAQRSAIARWADQAESRLKACEENRSKGLESPEVGDPECGVKSLQAILATHGCSISLENLSRVTGRTEFGSDLRGLERGVNSLGFGSWPVTLTPAALISAPKPAIAHVEHRRFVTVYSADSRGLEITCAGCGGTGAKTKISWKQWEALDADHYLLIAKPGSVDYSTLESVLGPPQGRDFADVLAANHPQVVFTPAPVNGAIAAAMRGQAQLLPILTTSVCGPGTGSSSPHGLAGQNPATDGDPVNLATGEESFSPGVDLSVYNPVGPSVAWARNYHSFPNTVTQDWNEPNARNDIDFGVRWSQSYNIDVYDPGARKIPITKPNRVVTVATTGTGTLTGTLTWQINKGTTVVATSSATNGWVLVRSSSSCTVTPPIGAALGTDYLATWKSTVGSTTIVGDFQIIVERECRRVSELKLSSDGTIPPGPSSLGTYWDLTLNGTVIADINSPGEWRLASFDTGNYDFTVRTPLSAALGSGYVIRRKWSSNGVVNYRSASFTVTPEAIALTTGPKLVRFPNLAQARVVANSVPTSGNPVVNCQVPAGQPYIVRWLYDSTCAYGQWEVEDKSQTVMRFKVQRPDVTGSGTWAVHPLVRLTDRLGHYISFSYYSNPSYTAIPALLSRIDDQNGTALLTISRQTGSSPVILSVADRYNRTVAYYWTSGFLTGCSQIVSTGTSNPPTRQTYSYYATGASHEKPIVSISEISPTGTGFSTRTFAFNLTNGQISSQTDALGNKREYSVPVAGTRRVTVKDPNGNVVNKYQVSSNSDMMPTSSTDGSLSTVVESRVYGDADAPYLPSEVTDGDGKTTLYNWDVYGNLLSTTTPRGIVTTYTYDYGTYAMGRLVSVQETGHPATTFTYYEPSGLLQTVTGPSPTGSGTVTRTLTYDSLGNILTVIGPGNNAGSTRTVTFNYTTDGSYSQAAALGQPIRVEDNLGLVSRYRYDSFGRVVTSFDGLGNQYDTSYNIAGQVTQTQRPATGQNGAGRQTSTTEYLYPGGPVSASKLFSESGALVQQVIPTYDLVGRVVGVSGDAEPSSSTYDADNRLLTTTDGLGRTTSYAYGAAGYLASESLQGETTTYDSYSSAGRLLQTTDPKGQVTQFVYGDPDGLLTQVVHPTAPGLNVTYSYDTLGRLQGLTDEQGTETYTRGDLDQLLTATRAYTGLPAVTLGYGYHADGSRASLTSPAGSFTYSYDLRGRLTGLTNPYSEASSWVYRQNDLLEQSNLPNGAYSILNQNAASELTSLTNYGSGGSVISSYTGISRDAQGNLSGFSVSVPGMPSYGGSVAYQYDTRGRLTLESGTRMGGYTHSYGLDATDNLTTFKGGTRTFNTKNQISAAGFSYDANGNPTQYAGSTVAWSENDHATSFGTSLTAGYDSGGKRAWKQAGSTRTYYIYDGAVPILELNSTGAVSAVNTWGAAGLVSRRTAGSSTFYMFDPMGSTSSRLNSGGSVLSYHSADAYGGFSSSVATTDPYAGFKAQHGYLRDSETGLSLCTYRYYDPAYGRFLNRDPIGQAGGLNQYAYCAGDPIGLADPLGLDPSAGGDLAWYAWSPKWLTPEMERRFSDFCAGAGDEMSFGTGRWIRDKVYDGAGVRTNSSEYVGGRIVGFTVSVVSTAGASESPSLLRLGQWIKGTVSEAKIAKTAWQLGMEGERAAGIVKNTEKFATMLNGVIVKVIPDSVTATHIVEVKNVRYLSLTKQIRAEIKIAENLGRRLCLIVDSGTTLAKTLANHPLIDIRRIRMR
ncbi:MAG: hypothetical protein JST40_11760 [Armatimonadetes bacterium]|nr:hypothetical protein [Armatimonadota bacterium]